MPLLLPHGQRGFHGRPVFPVDKVFEPDAFLAYP